MIQENRLSSSPRPASHLNSRDFSFVLPKNPVSLGVASCHEGKARKLDPPSSLAPKSFSPERLDRMLSVFRHQGICHLWPYWHRKMRGRKTIEGGRICGQPVHLNDCSSLQTKGRIVDVVERRTRYAMPKIGLSTPSTPENGKTVARGSRCAW
jgi:hypothetical protein